MAGVWSGCSWGVKKPELDKVDSKYMPHKTITAVICTRNREKRIPMALDSLAGQTGIDAAQFDVLVVDNGSTDATMEVVESYKSKMPFRISTAFEPHQGVSFARNRSLESACGDIIAYMDDDAAANPDWAVAHVEAYESDPAVRGVMGRIYPIWEGERPGWLDPLLESYLTIADYGDEPFNVADVGQAPVGANMSFLKQAMLDVGGFDVRFGFGGLQKIPHEENDIALRIQAQGGKVVYWPRATVRHGVPADRMTVEWFKKRVFDQGRGECLFELEHKGKAAVVKKAVISGLIKLPVFSAAAVIDCVLGKKARAARRASVSWYTLGYIKELVKPFRPAPEKERSA